MDFFNYAGLHRDVIVYIKPKYFILDIRLRTDYYKERMLGNKMFLNLSLIN